MEKKKLTPLEILQKQKSDLQTMSDELAGTIENRAKYLQLNLVPLLRNSAIESAISKMPPHLQHLAGSLFQKEKKSGTHSLSLLKVTQGIALGIAEIAPFFLKGKKGAVLSIVLKQVIKWVGTHNNN